MSTDIKRIAEAQAATADKFSKIDAAVTRLPVLESEVKSISMAVMTISGDIKIIQKDVKDLKNNVGTLQRDVKDIKDDVKGLKNMVDENLSNHEKRITKLEEKVV